MPTGTGKTVCVLSLVTSYQLAHPEMGKLIYCTRTVPEMTQCLAELKRIMKVRHSMVRFLNSTSQSQNFARAVD